jgi:hypothetical protein
MRKIFDIGPYPGQMLVLAGYFVFVGFIAVALAYVRSAHDQHKRGQSRVNLIGCTAAVTVVLLLLALVRSLV